LGALRGKAFGGASVVGHTPDRFRRAEKRLGSPQNVNPSGPEKKGGGRPFIEQRLSLHSRGGGGTFPRYVLPKQTLEG